MAQTYSGDGLRAKSGTLVGSISKQDIICEACSLRALKVEANKT
jgi:hypothetical protein